MWPENQNQLPAVVTISCLGLICAAALIRVTLVRDRPLDRSINHVAALAAVTVLVREPVIARFLSHAVPGGALVLYDVWHFTMILLNALIVALFFDLLKGPDHARLRRRVCVTIAVAYGIAFLVLSHPGRERGLLVQEALGWQYPTYFGIYAVGIVGCALLGLFIAVPLRRHANTRPEMVIYVVLVLSAVLTIVNMSAFYIGILENAAGSESAFAKESAIRANGELSLPNLAVIMLLLVPSCVRAIVGLLHVSREDRELSALHRVWSDLTAAAPEVVLKLTADDLAGTSAAERLHGMRVEVHDAIAAILQRSTWPDDDERARIVQLANGDMAIVAATELFIAAQAGPLDETSETSPDHDFDLESLSHIWPDAARIAGMVRTPESV